MHGKNIIYRGQRYCFAVNLTSISAYLQYFVTKKAGQKPAFFNNAKD
jgi:hypothetical protein